MAGDDAAPFDQVGRRYDESFAERDVQVNEAVWLSGQLGSRGRVLDLGCGSGLPTAKQLLDAGHEVVGVDESAAMLELARIQAPGGEYHHRDMRDLSGLGEFDAAVAYFSFLMLSRADLPTLLTTLHGMLRGPRLLLLSMVLGDFDLFPISFLGVPMAVTAYPPEDLRQVLADAGFEVVKQTEVRGEAEPNRIEVQHYLRTRAV
jgi:SAM-dependent methyltransferase